MQSFNPQLQFLMKPACCTPIFQGTGVPNSFTPMRLMLRRVSVNGTTSSQSPVKRKTFRPACRSFGMVRQLSLASVLYELQMVMLHSVMGASVLMELSCGPLSSMQVYTPTSQEHHSPAFKELVCESYSREYCKNLLFLSAREASIDLCGNLPQHSPYTLYSSIRYNKSSYLSQKQLHPAESGSVLHERSQQGTSLGSMKLCEIINYTLLSCNLSKLRTGFAIRMPFNLIGLGLFKLYPNIFIERSGIILPAQDSPAIQKSLPAYYGNFLVKKFLRASRLSLAVFSSLYSYFGSVLMLQPVPAGASIKMRLA